MLGRSESYDACKEGSNGEKKGRNDEGSCSECKHNVKYENVRGNCWRNLIGC